MIGLQSFVFAMMNIYTSDSKTVMIFIITFIVIIIINVIACILLINMNIKKNKYKKNDLSLFIKYGIGAAGGGLGFVAVKLLFYSYPNLFLEQEQLPIVVFGLTCFIIDQSVVYLYKYILQIKYSIDKVIKYEDLK